MHYKRLITLLYIFLICGSVLTAKDIYICETDNHPIAGASITCLDSSTDSVSSFVTPSSGIISITDSIVKQIIIEHPGYSSILFRLVPNTVADTVKLTRALSLSEVTVVPDVMTQGLTHKTFRLSMKAMQHYPTFFQALGEIPGITIVSGKSLFFQGNANVKLLLNGVNSTSEELATIAKEDISRIKVYEVPPARYSVQGYSAVIDVITKNELTGGNIGINIDQGVYPVKGDNAAALYYNYKRSRFSLLYSNSNSHLRKIRRDQNIEFEFDGKEYHKYKTGVDSHENKDNNNITLSFQNNHPESYLYNLRAGIIMDREGGDYLQSVTTNDISNHFNAIQKLHTRYHGITVSNYFEKQFGREGNQSCLMADVTYRRILSRYNSAYSEFTDPNGSETASNDMNSSYKTTIDEVLSEASYTFPSFKWGEIALTASNTYKTSNFRDSKMPISQTSNDFDILANLSAKSGKVYYFATIGLSWMHLSASELNQSYNLCLPSPDITIQYNPSRSFSMRAGYSYSGGIPSIAQLSETNQWLDTKLVYHGNSKLLPYKKHTAYINGSFNSDYVTGSLHLSYMSSPDMICSYFRQEPDYMLETFINLRSYTEMSSMFDITLKPLGNNIWTIWNRIITSKVKGDSPEYDWKGYRFQWMCATSINLNKWNFQAFYQYPGKIATGQLIRPRAQCWFLTALYRPLQNMSVGLKWWMPFGQHFKESERTTSSAIVKISNKYLASDWANTLFINFLWNFSFGRNKNRARPQIYNNDTDTGILKK